MLKYVWKRVLRQPMFPVAIMLTAAVFSVILCSLHSAAEKEAEDYADIYQNTPVTFSVTDLTGLRSDNLDAPRWVVNIFNEVYPVSNGLKKYVKDLKIKMSMDNISGITDMEAEFLFTPQMGGKIEWKEGYDESCFAGKERVCVAPVESLAGLESDEITLTFTYRPPFYPEDRSETITAKVAGTHSLGNGITYCPFSVMQFVYASLDKTFEADAVGGTLIDNYKLEEFREAASQWFAEPNYSGVQTPWDYSWYSYYPYALKIDDIQLRSAQTTMENSRIINTVCALVVFILSAGAGFLIGFQTVRSRKREIVLMRTMGTADGAVYAALLLEQMTCVLLGTVLGGAAYGWQPLYQLGIVAAVYCIGLNVALIVTLRKNLLTGIKEEED